MRLLKLIPLTLFMIAYGGMTTAHAQTAPVRAFAPWMALDNTNNDQNDLSPVQTEQIATSTAKTARAQPPPLAPVMTPRDTQNLIDQIYGGQSAQDLPLPAPPSALEETYSRRAGEKLTQYGYDQFGGLEKKSDTAKNAEKKKDESSVPAGAVQDDFILNAGDQLNITFRGQRQDSKTYTVTNDGQLLIDNLPPISAASRSIGQLREELQAQMGVLHNTQVFVSLDTVRQINVLVVGHVGKPGRQTLTVFNTVLDALLAAGGIDKTGSLRQIRLVRGGGSTIIDLYDLLMHGGASLDLGLRDGDRLIIPPIGPTIAVSGAVKRPGIYEIQPVLRGQYDQPLDMAEELSLKDILSLAGGLLVPGRTQYIKLSVGEDGRETVTQIAHPNAAQFSDGSILKVETARETRTGNVTLTGETRQPGVYALGKILSLASLLDSERVFGKNIYPLIGVIERRDDDQFSPQLIAFAPLQVIKGKFDRRLHENDVVHLFSRAQIVALQKPDKTKPLSRKIKNKTDSPDDKDADQADDNETISDTQKDNGAQPLTNPLLIDFLHERSAFVRGAVRQEGAWPVAEGATLDNLIAAAGGLTLEASTTDIEVTSRLQGQTHQTAGRSGTRRITVNETDTDPATIPIGPGDAVRVKQKFQRVADHSVLIIGEVDNPGRYDLTAGDRLSDLLKEAGGLTREAYPQGAIFSRESERKAEEMRFRAQAQQLELGLAAALNTGKHKTDDSSAIDANKIDAAQELIGELKNAEAVGRITVEADPGTLAARPDEDILLESGDRIYVPKRPLTVRVAGEVLSPASLQFRKDKDARDYINEAGGFTYNADKSRSFVVYPDGSAQPLEVSAWNHTASFIPPGSTVIVPRDPKPFDFLQTARDVSQILSNLAITGIFVHDIHDNNNN